MSSKKSKQLNKARAKSSGNGKTNKSGVNGGNIGFALHIRDIEDEEMETDYRDTHRPVQINPETNEDREKRLAARKARTLKAFQLAYENRHRRKVS